MANKKEKWYIPENIFCDVLDSGQILLTTPAIGVAAYRVHKNKNGDYWVKGDNIAKYLINFNSWDEVPHRAFLTDTQKIVFNNVNEEI
jgi:hypothetical protein